ncbi:uncharacterized protein C8A04DRAFT_38084 [Dichotomopilus funicola]|uniref:Glycoside hydrolase family 125 protein n=1 Tax=Dichotomopilus funicola TaxID=1934379 RepID=A0AAN6V0W7_9PEZI|nr:hypothetical protein C8A04DRAFT_38084 [Dichotomopilus funicola]
MKASHTQAALFAGALLPSLASSQFCPDYSSYSQTRHEPFSSGKHALASMRPFAPCRTFNSTAVESLLVNVTKSITDPDLARLFENTFPNTLDTAIRWRGHAADNADEELAFIITGDIDAMWLRDSANQLQSYVSLLEPDAAPGKPDSIASLYRGVINLQARYLLTAPFCNSFQPPVESGIAPVNNTAAVADKVTPGYDAGEVFECKYELDSLAAFLQISVDYYESTQDVAFFERFQWLDALQTVLDTARAMQAGTYAKDGSVNKSPYTFTRPSARATETLANDGLGSPVRETGLIRSAFRPSDDATLFQFLVPSNMLFARYLESASYIVAELAQKQGDGGDNGSQHSHKKRATVPANLADDMNTFSQELRKAITKYAVVPVTTASDNGTTSIETVYAYEVDGYGGANLMDDSNVPSLLAAPVFGYLGSIDPVYQRTRARLLSADENPYFMTGTVLNSIGGPHAGPGMAWPMASVVRILGSDDDKEIVEVLRELVGSTDGLGLMHESVNSNDASKWTRQWFSWANGLFGQMILDLRFRKPELLKTSFQ